MMAAQTVASEGTVYMPFKDGKVGMIDIHDIAEVAAKVLTEYGHQGQTYTLTGPASISFHEVAATLSRVLSREGKYIDVPPEAAREGMVAMGLSAWFADALNEYFRAFSKGLGDTVTHAVQEVTGHPARSYETFVHDFAEVFGGALHQAA